MDLHIDLSENLSAGQRIELHPATDYWMRGDRYATVIAIVKPRDRKGFRVPRVRVEFDLSGRIRIIPQSFIGQLVSA